VTFADRNNAAAHMEREAEQLLTHETPDFIAPTLWLANSFDIRPVLHLGEAAGTCVPQVDS